MIPYTDHNGKAAHMSLDEFLSCGYVSPREFVRCFSSRMTNAQMAQALRCSEECIADARRVEHINPRVSPGRWTTEQDAILRDSDSEKEAARMLGKSPRSCSYRAKRLGHRFRGARWQTWEMEMLSMGKSTRHIQQWTGRSADAIRRKRNKR
jgi:hypothetical protein